MKIKYFLIIGLMLCGSAFWTGKLLAQSADGAPNITFPVTELDNCQNEAACRAYCDLPQNTEACVAFGEKNNLFTPEEVQTAKKFIAAGGKGPGGCSGKEACETYCDNIDHIDECVKFGEENSMMSPAELIEAKQVQAALKRGVKMPNCNSKSSCDVYCEEPENMEECIAFGAEAGFIQGQELEEAQKMVTAIKRGVKPPPCRGKDACEVYCSAPENMEMCMNFALEAGFMSGEEAAEAQKMLVAVKKGVKPPACRGRAQCDDYCSSEEHFDECMNFAEAAGFMSAEEAIMARKTKGKTPGGCKGKEECEAFCNNPDNQETCFNFAKENDLISEEDLQKMEQGKKQLQESLNNLPPEVMVCVNEKLGSNVAEKIKSGEMMPSQEVGEKMSECFRQMGPPPGEQGVPPGEGFGGGSAGSGMMPPGGQSSGPGGCASPDECRAYCESHPQECQQFAPPQPPSGNQFPPSSGQYPPQEQFQPPTDTQYPPPDGQYPPPSNIQYPSPEGQSQPPEGQYPSPNGQYSPPTEQNYQAPPPSEQTFVPDTPYQQ